MMKSFGLRNYFLPAFVAVVAVLQQGQLKAVTLQISDDTLLSNVGKAIGGKSVILYSVASPLVVKQVSYIKASLDSLPANTTGADISKAVIWLYPSIIKTPGKIDIYAVTEAWDEETAKSGKFLTSAEDPETTLSVTLGNLKTFVPVDITDLVKDWVDGHLANQGVALVPHLVQGGINPSIGFDSKESAATSGHPWIEVTLIGSAGPIGPAGLPGASYLPSSQGSGITSNRATYDSQPAGFTYLDVQTGIIYVRDGAVAGSWIAGVNVAGAAGEKGDKGDPGLPGSIGPKGDTGFPGIQGVAGNVGAAGPQGIQGIQGVQGIAGAPGAPGLPGAIGATGSAAVGGLSEARLASLRWFNANTSIPAVTAGATLQPLGMCSDGTSVWVAMSGGTVVRKYGRDGAAIGSTSWGAASSGAPSYLVWTGDYIWVSRKTNQSVSLYVAGTGSATPFATVPASAGAFNSPGHLAFDGTYVWVANEGANTLTKIKASDRSVAGFATVPSPRGMAFDGTNLWVCSFSTNSLVKLDTANGTVLATYPVGSQPVEVAFDGETFWVANNGSNNVTHLSGSGVVLGTHPVESQPAGIVFDGKAVWTANAGSNTVTQLKSSDGSLIGTYPSGGTTPSAILFDGNSIWISNKGDGTLVRR